MTKNKYEFDPLDIIENDFLTDEEINKLRNEGKISLVDSNILKAATTVPSLCNLVSGFGPYKIKYKNIPDNYYLTNIEELLNGFYRMYKKYPNYHFDKLLECTLHLLSQGLYTLHAVNVLLKQIENEKNNISPFSIDDLSMLNSLKERLKDQENVDNLKNHKVMFISQDSNFDFLVEADKTFQEKGASLFSLNDPPKMGHRST